MDSKEMGVLYDHQAQKLGYSSCSRVSDNSSDVYIRLSFIRAIARINIKVDAANKSGKNAVTQVAVS